MTEQTKTEKATAEDKFMSRLNVTVAIIVAVIALLGSFITKIESDASTAADIAGNEEQKAYYDSIGAEINGAADINYSFGTVYQLWYRYDVQLQAATKQGDKNAIQTFTALRDSVAKTSALFDSKYFDANTGQVNLVRYKADQYGTRVYTLQEEQQAAADVSSAWSEKSSTYVLQLTLLAVAGFLLGLALMSQHKIPSLIFAVSGIALVVIITVWAYAVFQAPIFDLRQTKAISYFAEASSLGDQKNWKESLDMFTKAIDAAGPNHPYGHAYLQRARVYADSGQFESAIKDFQTASQLGNNDPTLNASLVWAYFQTGDFKNAVAAGTEAIQDAPDDLWLQQQLDLAILASGDTKTASNQYQKLLDLATQQVTKQRQLGGNSSQTWWLIDEAAFQLDDFAKLLQSNSTAPIKTKVTNPNAISKTAQDIASTLRTGSIALQYNTTAVSTASNATIGKTDFEFAKTPDDKYVYKVDMKFSYNAFETGQMIIIKAYRNGVQDPSWSFNERWSSANKAGQASLTISPSYSSVYIVPPGLYSVDIYINGQMLQRGEFTVDDPNNSNVVSTPEVTVMNDMLDQFDFYAAGFAFTDSADSNGDYAADPTFVLNTDADYSATLNDAYDFTTNDCSDPNNLTCSTAAIDCNATPDDPYCQQSTSSVCASDSTLSANDPNCTAPTPQACESNPALSSDDPNCVSSTPQACEYDPSLSSTDPNCIAPTSNPKACQYNPNLTASDPNCVPPTVEACQYDPNLTASDLNCVPPTVEACQYDPTLTASDPNCVPPAPQACEYDPSLNADDPNCVPPTATESPTP